MRLDQYLVSLEHFSTRNQAQEAIKDGIVYVKMLGACIGCSSIDITVKDGIEALLLEEVPGVIGVEIVLE